MNHDSTLIQIGLVADIQYGNKPDKGRKRFKDALQVAGRIADAWRDLPLACVVQLGDIIEGGASPDATRAELEQVLHAFDLPLHQPGRKPVYHVLGNHCLKHPCRSALLERLRLGEGAGSYHAFSLPALGSAWLFVVLDALEVAVDGIAREEAAAFLAAHPLAECSWAEAFNGRPGEAQMAWLRRTLQEARGAGQRVVVFSHVPAVLAAAGPRHLLWNWEEVQETLRAHQGTVFAWISGHYHAGGYALHEGVHHLTVPAVLENDPQHPFTAAILEFHPDHVAVVGFGDCVSRILK